MEDMFRFADALGPTKIVHITVPKLGLKGVVVIDNVAAGPAIGGMRMAPDVTTEECFRLARAMTLKNAAAGLRHGGAKSVLAGDPGMPPADKEAMIRGFACAMRDLVDYIPGPDMGTNEQAMGWVLDEIGRAVGLPTTLGGIPLDEIGATGFGLAIAAEVAAPRIGLDLRGARIAVQGFGSVGQHVARFLAQRGAILVAAADSHATLSDPDGLDIDALIALKRDGGGLADASGGTKGAPGAIVEADCDIWIPAARPDVITAANQEGLKARLILQGANIAITRDAEDALHARGVLSVPDFIANAGGVIAASVEYRGGTEGQAFTTIEERIRANTAAILDHAGRDNTTPRAAAEAIARRRVTDAMSYRRW